MEPLFSEKKLPQNRVNLPIDTTSHLYGSFNGNVGTPKIPRRSYNSLTKSHGVENMAAKAG